MKKGKDAAAALLVTVAVVAIASLVWARPAFAQG